MPTMHAATASSRSEDPPDGEERILGELLLLTLVRTQLNTGLRFVYPFLPALARGLSVSVQTLTGVLALRSLAGLAGPLFGSLSDRRGRRPVLIGAMLLAGLGCLLPLVHSSLGMLTAALVSIAVAKAIFDPALQGWVADRVPYAVRGRALATTEISWSAALLLGAPICAWLIAGFGWRGPFVALAASGLVGALAIRRWMRSEPLQRNRLLDRSSAQSPLAILRSDGSVRGFAFFIVCLMAGNELLLVVIGLWLERDFGLALGALGMSAMLIGAAELSGELGVAGLTDRLGKLRVVMAAGILAGFAYLVLPLAGARLPLALALVFVVFVGFEICYVGALPIASELAPAARGATMSIVTAATSLGRALGALAGGVFFAAGGLAVSGLAAAGLTLLALLALYRAVSETERALTYNSTP
jgi:predicted MFS family arabinose efflux permease